MSLLDRILGKKRPKPVFLSSSDKDGKKAMCFAVIDTEIGIKDHKVRDIGAWRSDNATFHKNSIPDLLQFLSKAEYVCGHNIINHDAKHLFANIKTPPWQIVDTLYMSPLLFPDRPYHRLVKDDKLISDQANNPVNDSLKARDLLLDEVTVWHSLPQTKKDIYTTLLLPHKEFEGFLFMVGAQSVDGLSTLIKDTYAGSICSNVDIDWLVKQMPVELAYALALADTIDHRSVTPGWVLANYPNVEYVISLLRHRHCSEGCQYCYEHLDIHRNLENFFGYKSFRTYAGEPLQEKAVQAAVDGKSLLAIFPTGGGKSLTFQLPALMTGKTVHGLTVVISPLLSLMKDQVDNLVARSIADAVTINGLLDPITKSVYIQRVLDGDASILYISPEMLRSATIQKILLRRHVVRFVIDEAHCFSSWGQDFRVDYLYIGKFIKAYQQLKQSARQIPVSCFTATAKPKVIQDICDYFKTTLGIEMELFTTSATRTNLHYSVIHVESDDDKYTRLRALISEFSCPTIVYVSRTKRTTQLAARLTADGYPARPFNGQMEREEKIDNQDAFMSGKVRIIVATSAFGMGVDKSDVGLVVHYDISDSLENYVQEAGRAGRDPNLQARCYVLYNDADLDKHFILLNQTKLSIGEIQQVWKAVKDLTRRQSKVNCSALEVARAAGWDDTVNDIETRVRTALSALEQAGFISRGVNVPHVYATGITVKNVEEARNRIAASPLFSDDDVEKAVRIIKSLISQKYIAKAQNGEAESRIDYLADILGLTKQEVISAVNRMRQEGILADSRDISACLLETADSQKRARSILEHFSKLEEFILKKTKDLHLHISYKQLNDNAITEGLNFSKEKDLHTLLYFMSLKNYAYKKEEGHNLLITLQNDLDATLRRFEKRIEVCRLALQWLYENLAQQSGLVQSASNNTPKNALQFSVVELLDWVRPRALFLLNGVQDLQLEDVEEALLYLSKIGALKLDGGFMVIYNAMSLERLKDNKQRFRLADYRLLDEFYKMKIQQVHIVGEFANLMVRDYDAALQFVSDYFLMDFRKFINKYFKGQRQHEIQQNITPGKFNQIFGDLSEAQKQIISDKDSRCIVVAAGPGSGKTKVLVHKLASLLLLEDVKHEQLLMLTFSRAAATEFKERLMAIIGNAAHFVEIKTFHGYCFDLLGRIGNLDDAQNVVNRAAQMIRNGEVEPNRINKTVLVIDEVQDIGLDEYNLIQALMEHNEEMRVVAVGDDDQCIFGFRGSDSKYLSELAHAPGSRLMELVQNYRSTKEIVNFANVFALKIPNRLKSADISAVSTAQGSTIVTKYESNHLYIPVVESVSQRQKGQSVCILTQTNDEAAILAGLLRKRGIECNLIQTMSGWNFSTLAEMRFFTKQIDKGLKDLDDRVTIPNDIWENAKAKTTEVFSRSINLRYVLQCAAVFERTNKTKYLSDFKEFVHESAIEDFHIGKGSEVVISTIHKAKGREFDDVHMLIDAPSSRGISTDKLRTFYVGISRAKNHLHIHTNSAFFDNLPATQYRYDGQTYNLPDEIILQLGHKDVYLGHFKGIKQHVLALQGGDELTFRDNFFYGPQQVSVARVSNIMQATLDGWLQKGYHVKAASVRLVVAWRDKNDAKPAQENAVLLPDLLLTKS